jgi:hypothetical protein
VLLEDRARIDALHTRTTIRILTGVGWCADIDIETAASVERDALVLVLTIVGQVGHDHFGHPGRLQLTGGELDALDRGRMCEVDVAVANRDPRGANAAEGLLHFEATVFVGIAQGDGAAAARAGTAWPAARHQRDVEITVRRRGHVPRDAEVISHDERAEPLRQRDATIVRVAHRRLRVDQHHRGRDRGDRHPDESLQHAHNRQL